MPISHLLLALLVVVVWGINFIFVSLGLNEIPPLLLCAIRFLLASVPALFFIKPPAVSFKVVALYGLVMFALQFSLLFFGMHVGMTTGMTSLIMQVQVFFSMFFALIFLGEKPTRWQLLGALISFSGIGLVAFHFDKNISLLGFVAILAAAATWGVGNFITKKTQKINMIALVVWSSLVASIPLLCLSFIFEGYESILYSLSHLTKLGYISVLYIVYVSTWIGYGAWNYLVCHHPVSKVVPFTLLVPIVAIFSSIVFLGESFQLWKLEAALLVISGLCLNLLGGLLFIRKGRVLNLKEVKT